MESSPAGEACGPAQLRSATPYPEPREVSAHTDIGAAVALAVEEG